MNKIILIFSFVVLLFISTDVLANEEVEQKEDGIDKEQLIIINKAKNELAFYEKGKLVKNFKIATGKSRTLTPEGDFQIIIKVKNMPYYKDNIPGGDPRNPLGPRWLGLSVPGTWGYTYGIHGNNSPWSIGTYASAGCVRMYNEEVKDLFELVEEKAVVSIVHSNKSFEELYEEKKPFLMNLVEKRKEEKRIINATKTKKLLENKTPLTIFSQPKTNTIVYNKIEVNNSSFYNIINWFQTKLNL